MISKQNGSIGRELILRDEFISLSCEMVLNRLLPQGRKIRRDAKNKVSVLLSNSL